MKNSTGTVEEINNYYPSGALFTVPVPDVQDYKYSGKELVDYADLGWYDYGARYYDPVLMRWHSADPLLEKYYSISPYAFCSNNFVNFVDPDGRAPRLYIQKSGIGHAFITTGEGRNTIVYSYGRYGALDETSGSTSGKLTPKGEGVLLKYSGKDAIEYLSQVKTEGNIEIYHISSGSDEKTNSHFDAMFEGGTPPSNPDKESFNNPNAKVIDTYSLLENNCVTTSIDGINVDGIIVESDAISPKGLARDLNKQSDNTNHIVKIEKPIDFINNLLKLLENE